MTTQAQILHGLIKHTKLKSKKSMLGFQDSKHTKTHENIPKNVSKALCSFVKSRNASYTIRNMHPLH